MGGGIGVGGLFDAVDVNFVAGSGPNGGNVVPRTGGDKTVPGGKVSAAGSGEIDLAAGAKGEQGVAGGVGIENSLDSGKIGGVGGGY